MESCATIFLILRSKKSHSKGTKVKATGKFITHVRWAYVAKILSASLGVPLYIIIGRVLGKEGYGLFMLTISILVFARILSGSGLGPSTGKHVSNLEGKNIDLAYDMVAAGFLMQTLTAAFFGLVLWLTAARISGLFGIPELTPALSIGALILVFFAVTEFSKASLQGLQRFEYLALVVGTEFTGKLIFSAGLTLAGFGLIGALDGFALALGISSIVAFFLFLRLGMRWPRLDVPRWRSLIGYSLPLMLTTASFVVYTELDNIMIGYFKGAAATGLYAAAMVIARSVPMFAVPIGQAAAPTIVKLRQSGGSAVEFTHRLLKYMVACFFPVAVGIFVLAPKLMVLVWGGGYLAGAPVLRVMSIFVLSLSTGVVIAPILDYLGKAGVRAKWMTVSVVVNVILNFILIPRYGGLGAAMATVLTHTPYVFNNVHILARTVGLRSLTIFTSLAKVFLASAAAGVVGALILYLSDNMIATLIAGLASYLLFLLVFGIFSRGEISDVASKMRVGKKEPASVK